jgi:pimeloyl-[acyl-carrier protein] synthase
VTASAITVDQEDSDGTGAVLRELLDPASLADPSGIYRRLHAERHAGQNAGRLVIGHADAVKVLGDRTLSSDRVTTSMKPLPPHERAGLDPLEPTLRAIVAFLDPPAHTRVRRLLQASFTPAIARHQAEVVRSITARLLDELERRGRGADLVEVVTWPLPALVVGGLLGIPERELDRFRRWAQAIATFFGAGRVDAATARQARQAVIELRGFMPDLLRHASREQNLLSAMVEAASAEDGRLTSDEVVANALFLMTAGHETAANQLANAAVTLLRHPEQAAELRDQPELVDGAVDEVLRFEGAVRMTARIVPDERELIARRYRPGEAVVVLLAAANRDPDRFAAPDTFDIHRPDNQPLSFGFGAHYCLGAALARQELRIVVSALFERFPALRLDRKHTVEWQPILDFRGPAELRVEW